MCPCRRGHHLDRSPVSRSAMVASVVKRPNSQPTTGSVTCPRPRTQVRPHRRSKPASKSVIVSAPWFSRSEASFSNRGNKSNVDLRQVFV